MRLKTLDAEHSCSPVCFNSGGLQVVADLHRPRGVRPVDARRAHSTVVNLQVEGVDAAFLARDREGVRYRVGQAALAGEVHRPQIELSQRTVDVAGVRIERIAWIALPDALGALETRCSWPHGNRDGDRGPALFGDVDLVVVEVVVRAR